MSKYSCGTCRRKIASKSWVQCHKITMCALAKLASSWLLSMVLAYFEGLLLVKFFLFDHILFSISFTTARNSGRIDYTMAARWEAGIARWQLVSQAVIRLPGRGVWDNPRLWLSRKCRMPAWAEATRRRIARSRGPTRISPSGRRTDPRAWVWLCAAVHLKRTQVVIRLSLTERPTQPLLVQLFRKFSS